MNIRRWWIVPALLLFLSPLSVSAASPSYLTSYNWSGYAVKTGSLTGISGSWVVPASSSDEALAADAAWVGIGGMDKRRDLIQVGTRGLKYGGAVSYAAWYELFPAPAVEIPLAVTAGDKMSATVVKVGKNKWSISISNDTTKESFAILVPYVSSEASAEWIGERPQSANGLVDLNAFGALGFSKMSMIRNGKAVTNVTAFGKRMVLMDREGRTLLSPSALSRDGRSFTIIQAPSSLAARSF